MAQHLQCPFCQYKDVSTGFIPLVERRSHSEVRQERNSKIVEMVKQGSSYETAAAEVGLSRQRVEQLCRLAGVRSTAHNVYPKLIQSICPNCGKQSPLILITGSQQIPKYCSDECRWPLRDTAHCLLCRSVKTADLRKAGKYRSEQKYICIDCIKIRNEKYGS